MNKRSKLFAVWLAVSAAVIIAGIVLFALLGFNTSPDRMAGKTVDIRYNIVVELSDAHKETLRSASENAFAANGVSYEEELTLEGQADPTSNTQTSFYPTGNDFTLRYVFEGSVSAEALQAAADDIRTAVAEAQFESGAEVSVSVHTLAAERFSEPLWRAAVGIAVGVVVALVYTGIRFGIGCALTGLTAAVHDVLLTLAFFAVTRVPVYAFAPWLYAAIAAAASLCLWLVRCMKLREQAKDPALSALSAGEAVGEACRTTDKAVLALAGAALGIFAVCAACLFAGGGAIVLAGALVPVAAAAYSAMLFAPALHTRVKAGFDKVNAKRTRHPSAKARKRGE